MHFGLDDDQESLAQVVRAYLSRYPERVAASTQPETLTPEGWQRFVRELDVVGLSAPEEHGGSGATLVELCVVLTELGRELYPGPFFGTAALALNGLLLLEPESVAEFVPLLTGGELTGAVVGLRDAAITARREGDQWLVSGVDGHVVDGASAGLYLVFAEAPEGTLAFVVRPRAPGESSAALDGFDLSRELATVTFAGTPAALVGEAAGARARLLDIAAVCQAAEQVGAAQRCLDLAVEHARTRTQFGRPIGSFQSIKHLCANIALAVESARAASLYAAWALSTNVPDASLAASVAKSSCSDALFSAATGAIQVLGGIGYTWEHPLHRYLRRAVSSRALFGSPDEHRERIIELQLPAAS